jgi:hypothetical protein
LTHSSQFFEDFLGDVLASAVVVDPTPHHGGAVRVLERYLFALEKLSELRLNIRNGRERGGRAGHCDQVWA